MRFLIRENNNDIASNFEALEKVTDEKFRVNHDAIKDLGLKLDKVHANRPSLSPHIVEKEEAK